MAFLKRPFRLNVNERVTVQHDCVMQHYGLTYTRWWRLGYSENLQCFFDDIKVIVVQEKQHTVREDSFIFITY